MRPNVVGKCKLVCELLVFANRGNRLSLLYCIVQPTAHLPSVPISERTGGKAHPKKAPSTERGNTTA